MIINVKNQRKVKKIVYSLFACFLISVTLMNASPLRSDAGKSPRQKKGVPYLSLSAGAGAWYASKQLGLDNRFLPFSFFVEYGRTSSPVSLIAGSCFLTTFNIDKFLLNPNNLLAGIQVTPLRGQVVSKKLNLYGVLGSNMGYSRFTEELYPGIINYEYKVERKVSFGLAAGAGMGYKVKFLEIKPMLYYFTGHSAFLAGHFTEQRYNTGSVQLHISINYRLVLDGNRNTCPVYYRYHKY